MKKSSDVLKALRLPAVLESLDALQKFVSQEALACMLSNQRQSKLQLALEEVLVNVINHGSGGRADGWVEVACGLRDSTLFCVEVRDNGAAFNPLEQDAPDLSESLEERGVGGLGIFLVRKMTDRITYRRVADSNVLTLCFESDA